jgi:hypothetical protein
MNGFAAARCTRNSSGFADVAAHCLSVWIAPLYGYVFVRRHQNGVADDYYTAIRIVGCRKDASMGV